MFELLKCIANQFCAIETECDKTSVYPVPESQQVS